MSRAVTKRDRRRPTLREPGHRRRHDPVRRRLQAANRSPALDNGSVISGRGSRLLGEPGVHHHEAAPGRVQRPGTPVTPGGRNLGFRSRTGPHVKRPGAVGSRTPPTVTAPDDPRSASADVRSACPGAEPVHPGHPDVSIHAVRDNVSPPVPEMRNDHPPMRNNPALRARTQGPRLMPRTRSGGDRLLSGSPSPSGLSRDARVTAAGPVH